MHDGIQRQRLFQPQIKQEFLQTLTEETQKPYLRVLQLAADSEYLYNTDLYDMNIDQIADVIRGINPLTLASARSVIGYIKKYIEWAITEKGLAKTNIHPLSIIDPSWYGQFVDFTKKLYFSEEEIFALEEDLLNGQDAVILRLLFEGVYGDGQNELLNLRMRDLSLDDNRIRLYDDAKGERTIEVSDRCVQLIREAYKQTKYFNRNGTVENARRSTSMLVDAGYIIKTAKTRGKNVSRAAKHVIYRRLSVISEVFEIPYLTTKNIWKSGQIKFAYDLYMRDGELGSRQFYEIADRFNLTKIKNKLGGSEHYNISLMKDYITSRNLKELYNIDIEI